MSVETRYKPILAILSTLLLLTTGFSVYSQVQINNLQENITNLESQIEDKNSKITSKQNTIAVLEGEVNSMEQEHEETSNSEKINPARPRIIGYERSESIGTVALNDPSLNSAKEGKIKFDIVNTGGEGRVKLQVEIVDNRDFVLEKYERTFEMYERERDRIEFSVTAPEGSIGVKYNVSAINGTHSYEGYSRLSTSGRSVRSGDKVYQ